MNKYIKEIKAYTFPELTGEAKEKAKEWYLNDETLSWELTNNYESDLSCIFPNSDLKVQWSLSYCQGDGVNIYGSVNMEDIFVLSQNAPAYNWIDGYLTEKEIRTLRFYMSEYKNEVKIPVNRRYSYCMADSIDLAEDFRYELENMGIRDIRVSVLEKAERLVKQVFSQLCMEYEKQGYAELYEISDEDMEEICESNGYYFLENGEFFEEDCIEEPEELSAYFDNNGDQCIDLSRDDDGTPVEEIGRYEVTFEYGRCRYYCFIDAVSLEEAMFIFRFFGSEAEVRILLLQLVRESRENDPDSYDNGTESKEEVDSYCSGWLNAYASFSSYHVDFTAVLFANMKSIKRNPVVRYVVKNIKWDTDGDQESFDFLPQEVILPAKFSKENYKDENGIFGKAEKIEMLDDISDWLSNGYGFCNNGFELTQKEV